MSDGKFPAVEGYIRHKKIRGTHRMYCPVRNRKVVLGKDREDGNIAYLMPAGMPAGGEESWERLDHGQFVAEAAEQEMQEKAGAVEGTLVIEEVDGGGYDVKNTATGLPINTAPLTKEQADDVVAGSTVEQAVYDNPPRDEEKKGMLASLKDKVLGKGAPDDTPEMDACPSTHVFGKDHDEHEECDECGIAEACMAKKAEGENEE